MIFRKYIVFITESLFNVTCHWIIILPFIPRKILIGATAANEACIGTFSSEDTISLFILNCSGHRKIVVNRRYTTAYKMLFPLHPVDCSSFVEKQVNGKTNTTLQNCHFNISVKTFMCFTHSRRLWYQNTKEFDTQNSVLGKLT